MVPSLAYARQAFPHDPTGPVSFLCSRGRCGRAEVHPPPGQAGFFVDSQAHRRDESSSAILLGVPRNSRRKRDAFLDRPVQSSTRMLPCLEERLAGSRFVGPMGLKRRLSVAGHDSPPPNTIGSENRFRKKLPMSRRIKSSTTASTPEIKPIHQLQALIGSRLRAAALSATAAAISWSPMASASAMATSSPAPARFVGGKHSVTVQGGADMIVNSGTPLQSPATRRAIRAGSYLVRFRSAQ